MKDEKKKKKKTKKKKKKTTSYKINKNTQIRLRTAKW